ncbi:MAG: putative manganese-dependent inorganic diphosphatase [Gemmatimonadota bacterium]
MPNPIRVFGHRNPDADAICSALAYADFKTRTSSETYEAARCGNSNPRIDAVLDHFGARLPTFVGDVTPRLQEIMAQDLVTVRAEATCAEALELIDERDIQVLPVVDEEARLQGIVSIFQLGHHLLPRLERDRDMRWVDTSVTSIVGALGAEVLHLVDGERVEPIYVRIAAMAPGSFEAFATAEPTDVRRTAIVVGDRRNIQERSIELGVRLLVITGGLCVAPEVLEQARAHGVSVIVSPYDSATTAWTIRTATRIGGVMSGDYVAFRPEETVKSVRRKTATLDPAVFMVTNDGGRLLGVFTRRDILRPSSTKIILVDHNELSQAVPGADQVEIVEVVDHHRLGDLRTQDPILFINRPVGSTCTIVADLYRQANLTPTREIAGVLMGGLVSDTLNLQSPTTTGTDQEILTWLEGIAGLTGSDLADIIFSSGSVVASRTPADVIRLDRKVYVEGDFRFAISQVEEVGFEEFWDRCVPLREELEKSRTGEGLDFAALLVTDVKSQDSLLLVSGSPVLVEAITYTPIYPGEIYSLPGVVSRKKQLLPFLTGTLRRLGAST